jgi:hypothetical protein
MVEVFKTNVKTRRQARTIVNHIHKSISNCLANFDLEDCDKILRITYSNEAFQPSHLIEILRNIGIDALVLPDEQLDLKQESNQNHSLKVC